jgi:ubiquinone/menaquinone biosynthesis C-methylase UbiE
MERRIHFYCEAISNGDAVLDLGCGTGTFLKPLAEHDPKGRLIGLDISPHMLAVARQRLNGKSNVQLREADISERLPFPDCSFDLVVASNINYELPDQEKFLREVFRVLKLYSRERMGAQLAAGLVCLRDNSPANQEFARIAAKLLLWNYMTCDELIEIIRHIGFHIVGHRPVFIENKTFNEAVLRRHVVFDGYNRIFDELSRCGYDPRQVSQGHIWVHAIKPRHV